MNSTRLVKLVNSKIYYGWVIVFAGALSLMFSAPGQTYSISTFIDSYIKDFGLSRTTVSSLYSTATLISGLMLVFMGKLVDRFGQRRMLTVVGLMLALSCLINSFTAGTAFIFFGFFLNRYFGQGSLMLIPSTLIPQWFEKNRALAQSIYSYGGTAAALLVPTLNTWLIASWGWSMAWRAWALLLSLIFVPLVTLLVVNKPEDVGLLPDNRESRVVNGQLALPESVEQEEASWTLQEAIKHRVFWFLGLSSTIIPAVATGLMFHFFSIMATKGVAQTQTAYVMGLLALPGLVVPVLTALIVDRWKPHYVMAISFLVLAVNLFFFNYLQSVPAAIIFILVFGVAMNAQGTASGVMWPNYFGRVHLGSIRALATMFGVVGSAFGPIPFGASFDTFGSYGPIVLVSAALCLAGGLMGLLCGKPEKQGKGSRVAVQAIS